MESYNKLKKKYYEIKSRGYIKSEGNYKNSVGVTLEKALGSTGGDFNIPDFYDIEIKAIRKYYNAEFDLFNSSPDGRHVTPAKWISEKFGYPDKDFKNIKVFKGNIYANKVSKIGLFYKFKLRINKDEERIYLQIYNYRYNLINEEIYWDFDSLKEKLERKDSKIAIFWYMKKEINNEKYFKFYKMKYYELKGFDQFLNCIEKGIVFVTFKTGVFKSGKYIGNFTDHGTSFRIGKMNMEELFNKRT